MKKNLVPSLLLLGLLGSQGGFASIDPNEDCRNGHQPDPNEPCTPRPGG